MSEASDHFHQLARELARLLDAGQPVDAERSLEVAQRREQLERELIVLLRPGSFSGVEARRSVRVPCQLGAQLRTSAERRAVMIISLSCGGAGLKVDQPLDAEAKVQLEFRAGDSGEEFISRFGRVCWVSGSAAGIEFEPGTEPLDQRMLRFVLELIRKD